MKFPFFKALLAASALALVVGCTEDHLSEANEAGNKFIVADRSFIFVDSNKNTYLISDKGIVTDTTGEIVGIADSASGLIIRMDQTPIATGVDFSKLEVVEPTTVLADGWILEADQTLIIYQTFFVADAQGNNVGIFIAQEGTFVGDIVSLEGVPMVQNVDLTTLTIVKANVAAPAPASSASIASSGSVPASSGSKPVSSGSAPKSSSSVAKSSSSVAKSSSSSVGGGGTSTNYVIKYIQGGKSGSGYASRYWDCCKPHCAWPEHGGTASTCDASGNKIGDKSATSMCDWGNAGICRSQFPIIINDTLAFAFAATPGGENNCGKCFDLAFTGKGKYSNDGQAKMKGKHLIVMSNNVGYDVAGGQFDVMIPGGGYGIFDGCSKKMGWGSQGSQYGGLLDECEKESNYSYNKYKSCLTNKCNASFSNDPEAKEGCLFMATWMNAAGNPLHNYKEVECPKELKDRY